MGRFQLSSYENKKVLVTGHTGFKGGWLCHALAMAGAKVVGFSLPKESHFFPWEFGENVTSYFGDVGIFSEIFQVFQKEQPEYVFHLAAQPIVLRSYEDPVETYQTNVMGTVHLCQCVNLTPSVVSFVNVTTDKVYENHEWTWGYRETDHLDGYDPYSNSKSCSELVTASFIRSFLQEKSIPTSTLRAGNVIGGGDRAENRIIPDCVRAAIEGKPIFLRNPHSVRPYQHVLEPVYAYLMVGMAQSEDKNLASSYNIGPGVEDCITTETMVQHFTRCWGGSASYEVMSKAQPHEANFLRLDCSKIQGVLGWKPIWNLAEGVKQTVLWEKALLDGGNSTQITQAQIQDYVARMET